MSKHISLASYELEAAARAEGYAHVCGADEAGAGPLMGPVYATAVILAPLALRHRHVRQGGV